MIKNSNWITTPKNYGDVCPIFKKEFNCDKNVEKAILHITSKGVYEAHLNGNRIGNFIMAPGWTVYTKRHQYQSYDITSLISTNNTLTISLGNGWCCGSISGARNIWSDTLALICALEITYTDSSNNLIFTDESWLSSPSAILFSEIYDGETYDRTYSAYGWENAKICSSDTSCLIAQEGEIVSEQEHIKPISMYKSPNGETIIDFGQNMTGYVSFTIDSKAGERLIYSHAEILDSKGNFYTENLRSAKQRVCYFCGDGLQTYKPHHTFMGFRYIRLEEAPKNISIDNFEAIVVHSDMERTGYFSCSNEKINKLFSNVIWGAKKQFS